MSEAELGTGFGENLPVTLTSVGLCSSDLVHVTHLALGTLLVLQMETTSESQTASKNNFSKPSRTCLPTYLTSPFPSAFWKFQIKAKEKEKVPQSYELSL